MSMEFVHNKMPNALTQFTILQMQSYQETLILSAKKETLILPLLFLLFLFLIYKWLSQNSSTTTTKMNLPPSPPRLPVIGNLHQLGEYPWRSFRAFSQTYGDIFLLHFGSKPTVVVSSSEMTSQILKTHDAVFGGRPEVPIFRKLIGNDIVASPNGDHWRRLKTICVQELLSKKRLESFRKVREEEVGLMVNEIERVRFVNLGEMFKSFTVDLTCRMCFGRKYRGFGVDLDQLVSDFVELIAQNYVGEIACWLGWVDWIRGIKRKVNRVASTIDEFVMGILEERLGRSGSHDKEDESVRDLVDVILEANRCDVGGNQNLGKKDIKSLILDIFTAGPETVYLVLEWLMSELLRNPRVMEKLRKEVVRIVGDKNEVTQDDLTDMKYLKAVLKETLRLHPPAPILFPHQSTKDVQINGFHIAKGTQVLVNTWSVLRDPRYWKDPEDFYPERFLESDIDFKGHDFEYTPFGSGRRMCPGTGFVTSIVELVVANLVHRFEWWLPGGEESKSLDMAETPGLLVHKKNSLFAIASPRM